MVLHCKWFMLPMTLDMPDDSVTRALAEDDNSLSEECAILCESQWQWGSAWCFMVC